MLDGCLLNDEEMDAYKKRQAEGCGFMIVISLEKLRVQTRKCMYV